MLTPAEMRTGLYGIYRLIRLDSDALRYFDLSADGARRSVALVAIALPARALTLNVGWAPAQFGDAPAWAVFTGHLLYSLVAWFGFLLIMAFAAERMNRRDRFPAFAAAFNWVSAVRYATLGLGALLVWGGLLTGSALNVAALIALIALILCEGYAYRLTLDIPASAAAGLVILRALFEMIVRSLL